MTCSGILFILFSAVMSIFFSHTVFGEHETARNVICLFFAGNEGIFIIENADRLGIPIPGFIRDRFLNMKKLNKKKVSA